MDEFCDAEGFAFVLGSNDSNGMKLIIMNGYRYQYESLKRVSENVREHQMETDTQFIILSLSYTTSSSSLAVSLNTKK